jgi:hypothetical protein
MYSGSGFTADKIGEFFALYDEAKKMPNFHSVCGILAEFYMEEVYREELGMFPMTEVSIFNCIRGNHGTDHEDYLRNTIDMLKHKQNELIEKNFLQNHAVHTENDRALERTIKLISLLHRELALIRKESDGATQQSAPISLSRVVSKSTQSANRRSRTSHTAEHSSRNLSPLPF